MSKQEDIVPAAAAEQKALDERVLAESRRHTRRSFALAAVGAAAGWGAYRWIDKSHQIELQPDVLRRAFQANASLSRTVFDERALAPTYPLSRAEDLRTNGVIGLKQTLMPESWRLQMTGVANAHSYAQFASDVTAWEYQYIPGETKEDRGYDTKIDPALAKKTEAASGTAMLRERAGKLPRGLEEAGKSDSTLAAGTPGLLLTMDDVMKFPQHELVTQFKCIEGWSQIAHWRGVRMSDLIEAYPPQRGSDGQLPRFVYLETPNGDYYVGHDMKACLHPQTLLVTEMGGKPLTQFHGAPLRMHMPIKYGYKQIKRIGLISYSNVRPDDYWTRIGYDWYAGL